MAVHEAAGLIDVSTLGKLIVRGPDAGAFLDRLYPNRFDNLKPGPHPLRRARPPTPAGSSTTARSAASTTTSSTSPRRRAAPTRSTVVRLVARRLGHATSTSPTSRQGARRDQPRRPARARDPRGRSPTSTARPRRSPTSTASARRSPAFRACCCGSASSASSATSSTARPRTPSTSGTRCWRPAPSTGSGPFGLEPQRVLRLQKLHILVGQDTDSESTPVRGGDAVDRQARQGGGLHRPLGARARGERGRRARARRLHARRRRRARPRAPRCSRGGRPVGQVTSARFSPQLGAGDRHGLGAGRAGRGRRRDHDLRRGPRSTRRSRPSPSTTPTARCCAHEPRVPRLAAAGPASGRRAQPDGAQGARGRRGIERRDGWNVAVLRRAAATTRWASPTSRTWASSRSRPRTRRPSARRREPTAPGGAR